MYSCKNELNIKFECNNHAWTQKLQILASCCSQVLEAKLILLDSTQTSQNQYYTTKIDFIFSKSGTIHLVKMM